MKESNPSAAKVDQLLDEQLQDYSGPEAVLGEQGLLKQLTKRLVEKALQAELSHHLQQNNNPSTPGAELPRERRNSRNGFSKKTVQAELGELELQVPQDRFSQFEPVLVKKGQRRISGLDDSHLAPRRER